jgi:hypothetical protein
MTRLFRAAWSCSASLAAAYVAFVRQPDEGHVRQRLGDAQVRHMNGPGRARNRFCAPMT